ncbi:MAG: tetratricopeptide repeat protein [Acidobacteria bacterium]|nr:tetratricopeptide repeat protein [Acidobacteriota bacterium]
MTGEAATRKLRRLVYPLLAALFLFPSFAARVAAQKAAPSDVISVRRGSINLSGDFKVEGEAEGSRAPSFQVVLYGNAGAHVARQAIANNGRYLFNSLPPGDYDIVVEVDGNEVARIHVILNAKGTNEVRQDITLGWNGKPAATGAPGAVRAPAYDRPTANKTQFDKARAAAQRKNFKEAAALFEQVASADPKDFEAWGEAGTMHSKLEKYEEAEKDYLRATEANPAYALAHLNLGKVRVVRKNYEGAAASLSRAVELQPDSAEANLMLGEAYLQNKKGSKAVGHLNEAARLGRPEAHLRLAVLYNAAGMKDKAAAEYEQFLAKEPNYQERNKLEQYITENKKR